ncbi:MAG: hypothetical protein IJQ13_04505 [Prevotella sp.]|nr:hypothetical protein [Prevotella sp.]
MERDVVGRYITNFRRFVTPYTKEGVSIKAIAYPYPHGAVIVFDMNFDAASSTEYRSDSVTMQEALKKTNLFDSPEEATTVKNTKVVWTDNYVIVMKGEDSDLWSEKASKSDVDNLIESISKAKNG